MTKAELIELLEDFPDNAEVRLMTQQNYPFENGLLGVWAVEGEDEEEPFVPHGADGPVVYLVEGQQLAYGTGRAWEQVMTI